MVSSIKNTNENQMLIFHMFNGHMTLYLVMNKLYRVMSKFYNTVYYSIV